MPPMLSCACALGRAETVALQNIADRLIGYLIPQVGQRPHNSVIAPVSVLLGHANDQLLKGSVDPRSARTATCL